MKAEFLIIKKEDDRCNSIETFKHMLEMDSTLRISEKEFRHKEFVLKYQLSEELIDDLDEPERVFHLTLERQADNEQKIQEHAESFALALKAFKKAVSVSGVNFKIVPLWDDLSVYYAQKSYPLIHQVENVMRKLIYIFMYKKIGLNWLELAAPEPFKEAIKKKEGKSSDKNPFQEILFNADFIHLGDFLFKEYRTADLKKLAETAKTALTRKDFDFNDLKGLAILSNWERFFSELVEYDGLEKKWSELYDLRNKVAHNKHLNDADFNSINRLSKTIQEKLEEAIEKIDQIEITREQREDISESAFNSALIAIKSDDSVISGVDLARKVFTNNTNPLSRFYAQNDQIRKLMQPNEDIRKLIEPYDSIGKLIDMQNRMNPFINPLGDSQIDGSSTNED